MSPIFDDSTWIDMDSPEAAYAAITPSFDDIVAMANIDDDPTVTTEEEAQMIAILSQVLGSQPITN